LKENTLSYYTFVQKQTQEKQTKHHKRNPHQSTAVGKAPKIQMDYAANRIQESATLK
jgi:hypothetical protein